MYRVGIRLFRQTDWLLLGSCSAAGVYGLLLIYSAAATGAGGNPIMQALCLIAGIITAWLISLVDYHALLRRWYALAAPTLLLMLLTFTPLGYEVPGTDDRNWLMLNFGSQDLLIQPSELLKIVFIVSFSWHIGKLGGRIRRLLPLMGLILHAAVPVFLILLQGDDGNAVIAALLCVAMLVVGGLPKRYWLGMGIIGAAGIPVIWRHMSPDKQARFLCLFQPDRYSDTIGWQQELSVTAIGSGQWCGVGYLRGGDHNLYARQNDFIFAVAGEELGFVGAVALLALLCLVLCALYRSARTAADCEGRLICAGMLTLIASQAVINIGMALRVMPVLGITLPFFSAGGSSLLTLFWGIGIAMSVYRHRDPYRLY